VVSALLFGLSLLKPVRLSVTLLVTVRRCLFAVHSQSSTVYSVSDGVDCYRWRHKSAL